MAAPTQCAGECLKPQFPPAQQFLRLPSCGKAGNCGLPTRFTKEEYRVARVLDEDVTGEDGSSEERSCQFMPVRASSYRFMLGMRLICELSEQTEHRNLPEVLH